MPLFNMTGLLKASSHTEAEVAARLAVAARSARKAVCLCRQGCSTGRVSAFADGSFLPLTPKRLSLDHKEAP